MTESSEKQVSASPGAGDELISDSVPNPIHGAILETLASAVIALESGVITYFNEAAASLTGLVPNLVLGKTFAEVFLPLEHAGEFTEAVLDAVYEGSLVRQRVVNATFASGKQVISISVTRTRGSSDATDQANGLAVVFEDVSEVLELREKELVLAREVESRHAELREAYLELEEHSKLLEEVQGKSRLVRIGVVATLAALVVTLVLWAALSGSSSMPGDRPATGGALNTSRTIIVEAQPLTTVVNVTGKLGPKREVEVTSPMTGKIAMVHVPYGAQVTAGEPLLAIDVTEVQIQQRDAEAVFIRARDRLQEIDNWVESVDASRARRSVTKARISLADSKRRLDETAFLLERGVIPATEQEAATRDYRSRELDLEAAEQDLAVILEKGTAEGRVARLELDNATARLQELEQTLSLAEIKAPIDGVVMRPPSDMSIPGQQSGLVAGRGVSIGEHLLTIGDVTGLSVNGQVDEVDVVQIKTGNPVRVTGDAFPGIVLDASISRVSSEAIVSFDHRSLPFFETEALIDSLTPAQSSALRIGMSVAMEVVVRQEDEVVLVPIDAIYFVNGESVVQLVNGEETTQVAVATGVTTLNSVEIVTGLSPGDEIRIP